MAKAQTLGVHALVGSVSRARQSITAAAGADTV